jgi:hypothetical protein
VPVVIVFLVKYIMKQSCGIFRNHSSSLSSSPSSMTNFLHSSEVILCYAGTTPFLRCSLIRYCLLQPFSDYGFDVVFTPTGKTNQNNLPGCPGKQPKEIHSNNDLLECLLQPDAIIKVTNASVFPNIRSPPRKGLMPSIHFSGPSTLTSRRL